MDGVGEGGHTTYGRLRAWNRRMTQRAYRYPWRYAALYATGYIALPLLISYQFDFGPSRSLFGVIWVGLFAVVGLAMQGRSNTRPPEREWVPPTDLTLGGTRPDLREDGRHWRSGGP